MRSKRYKKLPEKTNLEKPNTIENLIPLIKKNCTTKFDESVDLSILINNKQKKNEINIRSAINLPSGTGKKVKIAVVAEDAKQKDAKDSGADLVGGDDLIDKIKNGELNFEKLICTPSMMIKLSKLGKILGPKGLMPNPKLGTVTEDIAKAVKNAKAGQVELKNDKDGNIGLSFGKKSFSEDKLLKNFNTIIEALEKEKSNFTIKGDLIKNVFITSTMGVSYRIKLGKNI
tara:strand:- start:257 stop:946 length:690 start_codon:yes stop_codon:yes gene_type:complete